MAYRASLSLLASILAAAACAPAEGGQPRWPELGTAVVDSAVPPEVALKRFREGLRAPPGLAGGAGSLDELIRGFVDALERRDTAALRELLLNRAEFAFLYYPTVPEARPPYDLSPGLLWFLIEQQSRKGMLRALDRRGGMPIAYVGFSCEPSPRRHGRNTVWARCVIQRLDGRGDTVAERLFGPVLQHRGRFKFISYHNTL